MLLCVEDSEADQIIEELKHHGVDPMAIGRITSKHNRKPTTSSHSGKLYDDGEVQKDAPGEQEKSANSMVFRRGDSFEVCEDEDLIITARWEGGGKERNGWRREDEENGCIIV